MSDDRSREDLRWPEGEAPATAEEMEQAAAFAAALDEDGGGGALSELVDTAAMIRASTSPWTLDAGRKEGLVDAALSPPRALNRLSRRRLSWRRLAPALALAAAIVLVVGALLSGLPLADRYALAPPRRLPRQALSRPSNDLLGQPITDRAGASRRLDRVFADRLAGYRMLRLGRSR